MKTMLTKMMKIAAAGMVATSATLPAYADAVTDTNDVTAVVVGWQRAQEALGEQLTAAPASVREYSGLGGTGTYYVVSLEGGGYVVTSGDTSLEPVLAYSKTGTWVDDVKRNPLMAMLEIDIAAAAALETASVQQQGDDAAPQTGGRRLAATASVQQQEGAADTMAAQREANAAKWAKYKAGASQKGGIRLGASAPNSDLRVSPLIESAWSQTGPRGTGPGVTPGGENYYTPGNVYCGCVATMCAQMMKYWEWPKGTNISAIANYYGSVIFVNNSYGTAVTNSWSVSEGFPDNIKTKNSSKSQLNPAFGGTYDWANMPLTTQSSLTDAQKAAIGKLTRDAGIACCMGYSNEGSGASGSIFAHRAADQFAYTSGQDVGGWNDANRDALLACLDAGIPCGIAVSHSSSGHAIIADGYGYNSSGTLYVHFNYGWGSTGPSDWYTPPSVGDYNSVNDIIVNVYPPYVSKYDRTIVSGRVFSNGSVQSSVTVTATNRETGFSTNVTSNTKGIYSFMLPRGYYTFSATKNGSSAKVEADVKLGVAGAGSNAKSGNIHGLDLNLGTAVTAPSVALTHRWSFAGNLNDSVGSSTATKIGSNVNLVDGKAVCTGNGAGQGSLNLGSNLLDTDGATIEIWAANDEVKGGSRIFEYGVNTSHYFMMAWTKSTDLYVDCAEAFSDGANNIYDGTLAPFTLGRQYHIAVTFERQGDGTTKVRATRRDAASGAIQRVAVYSVTNGIHTFSSPILRLGRSFQGNADARATYDEVRVWQGVLSDAQLKASALAGPDANLSTLPWNASAVRYVAKAIWQGGTTAPTASSLASSANWSCTDQNGDAITGVPDHRSVVIIPNGTTAFTIPEGFTPNWRKLQVGSEGKATAQWGKKTYTQTSVSAQLDPSSADYTLQGDANVDELARVVAPSVLDAPAGLAGNQFRYDGWVYVTAAQAGRWAVSAYADDYAAFRLDDEWLAFTRVMDDGIRTAVADVPKGWHRFTVIIGDYYGGFGGCAMTTDHSRAVPVLVSIDGGNGIAFTSSNFQFGSPDRAAPVVTLAGDADWSSIGEVSLDSGAELDLNGHTLTIDKMDSSFLGANIKDTSATPGTIAFAEGGAVNSGNITVQSNVKKAYANAEALITAEATFWLDASDVNTITTNASGEVTRWNSRVGSNYATQGRNYYAGSAFLYPTYDATTYGIPTVDFGNAVQSGWDNSNPGRDLNINTPVVVKTVFFVTRIQKDGKAAWLGQEDAAAGTGNCFRRDEYGAYNDKRSGQPGQSRFANFWIGTDVVADMTTEYPPEGNFCVFSAQMDDAGTYAAQHLAEQCGGLHSGGKQLSELIIFNRALSDEERTEVTQYLQTKWIGERSVFDDAIFWLDASDVSTITTNASGEVTRWNSRVGSNYATQGRNYYAGSAFLYPTYDVTTYGIPTVDFGNAVLSGWDNANPGRDLNINTPVAVKTVFFVTRIQKDGKAAWLGQADAAAATGNCFRRDEYGAYNDKRSGQPGQSRFANFWIGAGVVSDMTAEYPPADRFCVFSAQMDDAGTYEAQHLAEQCGGLHSGGKQLSELLVFNRVLTDEERIEVTRYLQNKWHLMPDWTDGDGEGYTALKYIKGSGNGTTGGPWIITDITPVCTDTVKMRFKMTATGTQTLWCSRGTKTTTKTFTAFYINQVVRCDRNGATGANGATTKPGTTEECTVVADYNALKYWVNGVQQSPTMADGTFTPDSKMTLFASHTAGSGLNESTSMGNKGSYYLYYFQLYSVDGTLAHNLMPARRESDSVIGLYDTVERKFYEPIGGTFTSDERTVRPGGARARWTGLGNDNKMSNPDNWEGGVVPDAGSDLDFTLAAPLAEIDADIPGTFGKMWLDDGDVPTFTGSLTVICVNDMSKVDTNVIHLVEVVTATWTGAAGDNDVTTPENWNCYDSSSNLLPGALPMTATTVTVDDAPEAQILSGETLAAKWLNLGPTGGKTGTLTVKSGGVLSVPLTDNRSIQMGAAANSTSILNVDGGTVEIGSLNAGVANVASKITVNVRSGTLTMSSWTDFGRNAGTTATFNQSGGTVNAGGNLWIARNNNGTATYNLTGGTLNQNGGSLDLGEAAGCKGIFNMSGNSTLTSTVNYSLGRNGVGEMTISGGTTSLRNVYVGHQNSARGTITQTGGTFTLGNSNTSMFIGQAQNAAGLYLQTHGTLNTANANANLYVGDNGRGVLDAAGTVTVTKAGYGVVVGSQATGRGELRLRDGGSLTTSYIKKNNASAAAGAAFGAGTLTTKQANTTFVNGMNGLVFDPGTFTLNAAHNVTISGNAETFASAGARVAKTGAGTVTIDKLPPVDDFAVNAGTVALSADNASARSAVNAASGNEYPASPSATLLANNYLLHRWNFNGHCLDLIGTNHAFIVGSGSVTYNSVADIQIPGGNRGVGYIDCGSNIIPAELGDTPFTIEFWAKPKSNENWAQWFAFGNSSDANGTGGALTGLIIAPKSGAGTYPSFRMVGAQTSNNIAIGSGNLTLDKEYHVALVVKPTGNNTATVTAYIEDPSGGEAIRVKSESVTNWSTSTIVQKNFWLGHSHWGDKDVYSTYNEVRVWAAALSQEQIVANGTLGPDVLPVLSATSTLGVTENITVASGATLDLGGHTLTQPRLTGAGTVQNGTLNVGTLAPGGDGTSGAIALNVSSVSGVIRIDNGDTFTTTTTGLDLSGATIDLATTPTRSFVVGTASGSGSFAAGRPALTVNGAPLKGWMVKRSGNTLKVSKGGVMIIAK